MMPSVAPRTSVGTAMVCVLLNVAQADGEKSKSATPARAAEKPGKEAKVLVTGSNIPQKVVRGHRIPTTHSPVVIIDRTTIERSGRQTLLGVLAHETSRP